MTEVTRGVFLRPGGLWSAPFCQALADLAILTVLKRCSVVSRGEGPRHWRIGDRIGDVPRLHNAWRKVSLGTGSTSGRVIIAEDVVRRLRGCFGRLVVGLVGFCFGTGRVATGFLALAMGQDQGGREDETGDLRRRPSAPIRVQDRKGRTMNSMVVPRTYSTMRIRVDRPFSE